MTISSENASPHQCRDPVPLRHSKNRCQGAAHQTPLHVTMCCPTWEGRRTRVLIESMEGKEAYICGGQGMLAERVIPRLQPV
jgi:hypothetical protein